MTDSKINVAILGVGNCASSFVQGLEYYKSEQDENGLISDVIGGYRVSDIEVVCAFDINKSKVGKDLSEAIFEEPNNKQELLDYFKKFNQSLDTVRNTSLQEANRELWNVLNETS